MTRTSPASSHLHVPLAHLNVVFVPSNGAVRNLAIDAGVFAKLVLTGTVFQIEQMAEK